VDGIAVSSATNNITGAIPGVTFQLLSTSVAGTTVQVQITNDNTAVLNAFGGFVNAYNTVVRDIKTQEGKDASGNAEPLFGNATLAQIQSQLVGSIYGGAKSGSIGSVVNLGITSNQDGTLALNTDTLQSALNNNYSDVTGFLQNTGSFGQSFISALNNLGGQAPSGVIYLAQQQNSVQEAALNRSVSDQEARLAAQKISLTAELNAANQILQSIPSQLNQINEIYSATTGYNSGTH